MLCWHGRYEGTGRSLSLKLIQQLRSEGAKLSSGQDGQGIAGMGRTFREVQLQEPIRSAHDSPAQPPTIMPGSTNFAMQETAFQSLDFPSAAREVTILLSLISYALKCGT